MSEQEIDPWTTFTNDAASKAREQYKNILQTLLVKGHDDSELSEARQKPLKKSLIFRQNSLTSTSIIYVG